MFFVQDCFFFNFYQCQCGSKMHKTSLIAIKLVPIASSQYRILAIWTNIIRPKLDKNGISIFDFLKVVIIFERQIFF